MFYLITREFCNVCLTLHKVENRVQKPLALKHELCRPMTVKRDMSIWIGEKDFAGCPSNATVFSFPTFLPREFFSFKEVLGADWMTTRWRGPVLRLEAGG